MCGNDFFLDTTHRQHKSAKGHLGEGCRVSTIAQGIQDLHLHGRLCMSEAPRTRARGLPKAHLARHCNVVANEPAAEKRADGRGDGDAGRGAVLGRRALGEMDVQVRGIEQRVSLCFCEPELGHVCSDPGERRFRAFLSTQIQCGVQGWTSALRGGEGVRGAHGEVENITSL
eukprot:scaffold168665_cov32-Tisochrysis_lutea.AAC.3